MAKDIRISDYWRIGLRPVLYMSLGIWTLLGIGMGLIMVISFVRPLIETHELYELSQRARVITLCSVAFAVFLIFLLRLTFRRFIQDPRIGERLLLELPIWVKSILFLCFVVLLLTAIQGFRNVHPEEQLWVSTGHAGRWAVNESVARDYLWLAIRALSTTAVFMSVIVSFVSTRFLRFLARLG